MEVVGRGGFYLVGLGVFLVGGFCGVLLVRSFWKVIKVVLFLFILSLVFVFKFSLGVFSYFGFLYFVVLNRGIEKGERWVFLKVKD